jgi:large subunit ribosomal protein L28
VSKVCDKCGKKPVAGRKYARRGLAKYKGGVGRKITGITKRTFTPNIQIIKVRETNGTVHRVRVCTKCLKTGVKNGTILKAARKPRPPKQIAAPVAPIAVESEELQVEEEPIEAQPVKSAEERVEAPEDIDAEYDKGQEEPT